MRTNEIAIIKSGIKRERNLLVLGDLGLGKSWLLKQSQGLYFEPCTSAQLLKKICKNLRLKPKKNIDANLKKLRSRKIVLLLDDFNHFTLQTRRIIARLNATVIATSEKRVRYAFHEVLKLKPLRFKESKALVRKILRTKNKLVINLIANVSGGSP
jgi:hypothetical protein